MVMFLDADKPGWTRRSWVRDFPSKAETAIDPYVVWADLTDFWDGADTWAPVILELTGTAAEFAALVQSNSHLQGWIRVPNVYRQPVKGLERTTFCTATITWEALNELGETSLRGRIKRFELGYPDYRAADVMYREPLAAKSGSPPAPAVVVGIVDDGLAFAHERFRGADGRSRVEYFWNQDGEARGEPDFRYGSELNKVEVDALLQHPGKDEDRIYREAGQRFAGRRATHGTHVMDLACGEDPAAVPASAPRIICVQLPRETTRDTSGRPFAVHALDGLRYILDRADRVARGVDGSPCPVVVNMSYGKIAGPHDGTSILEAAIDELIQLRRNLAVVIPAGNNLLSRCHAKLALAAGAEQTLRWRIQPDDTTPSFLELWLGPDDDPSAIEIEVVSPTGEATRPIKRENASTDRNLVYSWMQDDEVLGAVVWLDRVATGRGRMILVAVAPTTTGPGTRRAAPAGTWSVRVKANGRNSNIEAWIQRDDTPFGFPRRGRQSRFDDPAYERFDALGRLRETDNEESCVKRAGTINAIGTGEHTVVVGGYRHQDRAPAPYSAAGPTLNRERTGPDALTVSERSRGCRGVLAAGARSGSVVAMDGTSVAAPQVTRWIAEQMAAGRPAKRTSVRAFANEKDPDRTNTIPGDQPKPTPDRGGGGRLPGLDRVIRRRGERDA